MPTDNLQWAIDQHTAAIHNEDFYGAEFWRKQIERIKYEAGKV